MAIYQIVEGGLKVLSETKFEAEGLYERGDLQRLLRQDISALGEDLLVIAEEFGDWVGSSRRIDLLAIDRDANLVVVELKRTDDGGHMELQAIRYAAMVAGMTFEQALEAFTKFTGETAKARAELLDFLHWQEIDEEEFARQTRIILVSADFGKELTTAVTWLREFQLDIQCIRMKPYKAADGSLFLDIQKLIPLPELKDFQTQIGRKKQAERQSQSGRDERMLRFWAALLLIAKPLCKIHEGRTPTKDNWLSGSIGRAGFSLSYSTKKGESKSYLWINFGSENKSKSKEAFHQLLAQKDTIEAEFGGQLEWQDNPNGVSCEIRCSIDGGYDLPEEQWPQLHLKMAEAMVRLDKVFRGRVAALKL